MRVLHICSYFLGSNLYKDFSDGLDDNSVNSTWYVPVDKNNSELKSDSKIIISTCFKTWERIFFYLKQRSIYRDLVKQVNLDNYNLIHAHTLFTNGNVAYKIYKKTGKPYVVAIRNTDVNVFFKKLFYLRRRGVTILKNASKVIFLSKAYRDNTIKEYVPQKYQKEIYEKSIVIPNGIDEFWHNQNPLIKSMNKSNSINILCVGNISKNKNMITVANTCTELEKDGYKVSLSIVGKIYDENVFNKLKQFKFVGYLGEKNKEELLAIYQNNDIFILPSIHETFGLVYAEAISQGLPIIYTKGQGFDQQFSEGIVGYGVDCFDVHDIRQKVLKIMNNYDEVSANCIKYSNKFSWVNVCNAYRKTYKELTLYKE